MAKYNWKELEKEYLIGNYKSVREFLKYKNIPNNGSTKKSTKGWKNKKVLKEEQKSTKIIEKVIEKEAEKESKKIISVKDTAEVLLLKINKSIEELDKYISRNKTKVKTVEFDYQVAKPSKETTTENEIIDEVSSIIDKNGLKQLTSALKDLNDIINRNDNQEALDRLDELLEEQRNA